MMIISSSHQTTYAVESFTFSPTCHITFAQQDQLLPFLFQNVDVHLYCKKYLNLVTYKSRFKLQVQ